MIKTGYKLSTDITTLKVTIIMRAVQLKIAEISTKVSKFIK